MNSGFYITKRVMPEYVRMAAQTISVSYSRLADDWLIRLEKGTKVRWVVGYKFDLNTSGTAEIAQDKAATYEVLHRAGAPCIEHYLVRSVPHEPVHIEQLRARLRNMPVVLKPLNGTGGRGVELYESVDAALDFALQSQEPAWAISPHYDFSAEYRLVLLDGTVLLSLEKTQPSYRGKLKLFNLGYGAVAVDITDSSLLAELTNTAMHTVKAMGLRLAAVDIVRVADGSLRVLEVNDGIMLESYAQQSAAFGDRAATVYETIVQAMFE